MQPRSRYGGLILGRSRRLPAFGITGGKIFMLKFSRRLWPERVPCETLKIALHVLSATSG